MLAFAATNNRRPQDRFKPQGQNNGRQNFSQRNTFFCDHCKVSGHTIQRCYKLHGYPPHFKDKKFAANVQSENTEEDNSVSANLGLTSTQYAQLLQLLGKEQSDNSTDSKAAHVAGKLCLLSASHSWIMDSGATDHMCYDLNLFSVYTVLQDSGNTITIPNGKQVLITHIGTIHLKNNIVLEGVLFVPDFKFNLISIPKLCKDLQSMVTFTNNQCFSSEAFNDSTTF